MQGALAGIARPLHVWEGNRMERIEESMLTDVQGMLIVLGSVAGSLLFMWVLNRIWPPENRREHNDQIGWQLTALGTTYAVILGFMLYAVWTNFEAADLNVDLEADSLVNVFRLADGLPAQQRAELEQLSRSYADVAINQDWPTMVRGELPNKSMTINGDMWKTLMSIRAASPTEIMAEDHALYELSSLTQHRRTRVLQSTSRLPRVLWGVLLVGGMLTVASSCLFGSGNSLLHTLQVFAFSLLIGLGLLAIAQINRPFQGAVHISTFAFKRAQDNMQVP